MSRPAKTGMEDNPPALGCSSLALQMEKCRELRCHKEIEGMQECFVAWFVCKLPSEQGSHVHAAWSILSLGSGIPAE